MPKFKKDNVSATVSSCFLRSDWWSTWIGV